uniref:Tick transposon n=1 Tax=Rhipicephalus zambeziensis TaxID=60191 RepID=A0A224Z1C0_9ACAR
MHQITHRLKKVGQRMGVRVVSSAPRKLSQLAKLTCAAGHKKQLCKTKHRTRFVNCISNVVYRIPLSCGACYIGQTGRCLNDRLREHACNVRSGNDGFLAQHASICGCHVQFDSTTVVKTHKDERTRLIIEAENIARENLTCVSKPSVALSDDELAFLESSRWRRR